MPGFSIDASCDCGYSAYLDTGATYTDTIVIAYNSERRDIVSLKESEAISEGLEIIKDPFIDSMIRTVDGYFCPHCKRQSLKLFHSGYWD